MSVNKAFENDRESNEVIKVLCWNLENIISKARNKDVLKYFCSFHIIGLLETWLQSKEYSPSLPGFSLVEAVTTKRKDRRGRFPGGISIYAKEEVREKIRVLSKDDSMIWIEMNVQEKFRIAFLYNQPIESQYTNENILELLQHQMVDHGDIGNVVILGDFNARTAYLDDRLLGEDDYHYIPYIPNETDLVMNEEPRPRNSKDKLFANQYGRDLIQFCSNTSLRILNGRSVGDEMGEFTCYTHNGKSLVDYGLCHINTLQLVDSFVVGETLDSSHMLLELTLRASLDNVKQTARSPDSKETGTQLIRYKWNDGLSDMIKERCALYLPFLMGLLNLFCKTQAFRMNELVTNLLSWFSVLFHPIRARLGKKYGRKEKEKPLPLWVTTRNNALRFLRRYRRNGDEEMLTEFLAQKNLYKEQKKAELENVKKEKEEELKEMQKDRDWKSLWKRVKRYVVSHSSPSDRISPEQWKEHFANVYNVPLDPNLTTENWEIDMESLPDVNELDKEISPLEVGKTLREMKLNKAPGMDGIPNACYKKLTNYLAVPPATLYTVGRGGGVSSSTRFC